MSNDVVVTADEHDPSVHHEERDVNVRGILVGIVGFVIFCAILYFALWYLFEAFRRIERREKNVAFVSQVQGAATRQLPPAPHLQPFPEQPAMGAGEQRKSIGGGSGTELTQDVPRQDPWKATPVTDMDELKRHYDEQLHSYGWVDKNRGIVHVPIEVAKEKLLQKGLPVGAAAPVTPAPAAVGTTTAVPQTTTSTTTDAGSRNDGGIRR
jgi:hypothetical protein